MMRRVGISIALALAAAAIAPGAASAAGDPADFGVTLDGPASSSVGGTATYSVVVSNAGPGKEAAKVRLTRGHGATNVDDGDPLRTQSQTTTQGTCFADKKGVICRLGEIDSGATVKISVGVKVFDTDIPKLPIQVTVQPDIATTIDPNAANDHVELVTSVRAPLAADGIPDRCASKPFSVKVTVDVPGADQTKAIIDGKTIDTSSKSSFKFKVDTHDLDKGNHSLSIVAQGKSGPPLATLKRKFKTC